MENASERLPQVALRTRDLERSVQFYLSLPDFRRVGEETPARLVGPGGVPILLGGPQLEPVPGVPMAAPAAWVYLHRPDLTALAHELARRGLGGSEPIDPYPGYRHLLLPDPDGYVLAFWESLPLTDLQILDLYRGGPGRLRAALNGLTEAELDQPWAPGKWPVRTVIHHLIDSDLATFQVIRQALALSGRTIQSDIWEPDEWIAGLRSWERPVGPAVDLYSAARAWVLEAADHLPDALSRWIQWPSGYRAEVRDLLRQAGGHALHHTLQVEEARRQAGR